MEPEGVDKIELFLYLTNTMSLDIVKSKYVQEKRLYPKDGSYDTTAKFLKVRTNKKGELTKHKYIKLDMVDHSDTQGIWFKNQMEGDEAEDENQGEDQGGENMAQSDKG